MSRVVIVGAGFGGLGAAHTLVQSSGAQQQPSVTVVEAKDWFTIGGAWQYAWSGRVAVDAIDWPLEDAREHLPGVDLRLNTTVVAMDLSGKTVTLSDGARLEYDHLVLSPGVVGDASGIEGMGDALDMYSHDSVERQAADLADIVAKARAGETQTLVVAIGATPYKCPVAPFEAAFIADDTLRRAGCRENVRIVVTSPVPWPLPDPAKEVFTRLIAEKEVDFIPNAAVAKVTEGGTTVHFADDVVPPISASRVWAVYPQTAPKFIKDAGIANPKGFVPVDIRTNRVESAEGVYCIGDCCGIMVGAAPHPKAGEFAWQMGEMVANIIKASEGYEHVRLGACIAECGAGAGVLVAPDFTAVVKDPTTGKPKCSVVDRKTDGEVAKIEWVNKYIKRIFGEGGRMFEPNASTA